MVFQRFIWFYALKFVWCCKFLYEKEYDGITSRYSSEMSVKRSATGVFGFFCGFEDKF